jgi:hypothetical protein
MLVMASLLVAPIYDDEQLMHGILYITPDFLLSIIFAVAFVNSLFSLFIGCYPKFRFSLFLLNFNLIFSVKPAIHLRLEYGLSSKEFFRGGLHEGVFTFFEDFFFIKGRV